MVEKKWVTDLKKDYISYWFDKTNWDQVSNSNKDNLTFLQVSLGGNFFTGSG